MSTAFIFGHGVVFADSKWFYFFSTFLSLLGWKGNSQGMFPEPGAILNLFFFFFFSIFSTYFYLSLHLIKVCLKVFDKLN